MTLLWMIHIQAAQNPSCSLEDLEDPQRRRAQRNPHSPRCSRLKSGESQKQHRYRSELEGLGKKIVILEAWSEKSWVDDRWSSECLLWLVYFQWFMTKMDSKKTVLQKQSRLTGNFNRVLKYADPNPRGNRSVSLSESETSPHWCSITWRIIPGLVTG